MSDNETEQILDGEEVDSHLLKGDAIGDTLFSEKWVLGTLMDVTKELPKYSASVNNETAKIELEEKLETDLCFLWDMTADKDVAFYLLEQDIFPIISCILEQSAAPRLTEIMIGILANISCHNVIALKLCEKEEKLVNLVISNIANDDVPTIIQCFRLLDALLWSAEDRVMNLFMNNETLWTNMTFVLANSLNEELLCSSSKFMANLINKLELGEHSCLDLPVNDILIGLLESMSQLRKTYDEEVPKNIQMTIDMLLSSLYNLSRLDAMRHAMRQKSVEVNNHLKWYLQDLLKYLMETTDEMATLKESSLEALTLLCIVANESNSRASIQTVVQIGRVIHHNESNDGKYSADFSELFSDYMDRLTNATECTWLLEIMETFDSKDLTHLSKELKERNRLLMDRLLSTAKDLNSYNKVMDIFETTARSS